MCCWETVAGVQDLIPSATFHLGADPWLTFPVGLPLPWVSHLWCYS